MCFLAFDQRAVFHFNGAHVDESHYIQTLTMVQTDVYNLDHLSVHAAERKKGPTEKPLQEICGFYRLGDEVDPC